MTARVLLAVAVADFRERVRRPAFAATLAAAMALGFLAIPHPSATFSMVAVGDAIGGELYRGVYDSAYVGTITALVGGLWLGLGGFYVVKNTIARDTASGVGQILAATPVRTATYLFGKFLSNLMVVAAMATVLAVTALAMQLLRGESQTVDPAGLWLPFLLLLLPVLAVVAAAAVLFETVRSLRGGLGNVVWSAVVGAAFMVGMLGGFAFDLLGFGAVAGSMGPDLLAQHSQGDDASVYVGMQGHDRPLDRFDWSGLNLDLGLLAGRLALVLFAVGVALLPALWFGRFDPTRRQPSAAAAGAVTAEPAAIPSDTVSPPPAASQAFTATRPRTPVVRGHAFGRLLAGELRILIHRVPRWWLAGALALIIIGALVPPSVAANPLLPLAWIWPMMLWSRLGTQSYEHNVHLLVDACPAPRRRLAAGWTAALLLTTAVGLGPLLRMGLAGDWPGTAAWLAGALFIPALALVLGSLSHSPRLFQGVYLALWYLIMNRGAPLDFMGAVREHGQLAGPNPLAVAGIAVALLAAALTVQQVRHARR